MEIFSLISPSKHEFDNAVNKILDSPGYKNLKNPLNDFVSKVKNYIADKLLKILIKLFSNLKEASSASNKLSLIFIIIFILAIMTLAIVIILHINRKVKKSLRVKKILGEKIDDRTTPYSLKEKAMNYSKQGNFRQAIRYDFISILLLMHENRLLYLDETKTNEENYNFLQKNRFSELTTFHYLIDAFNSSWYGHKKFSDENYEVWKNNIAVIWNEVMDSEAKGK